MAAGSASGEKVPGAAAADIVPELKPDKAVQSLEEDKRYWGVESSKGASWKLDTTKQRAIEGSAMRCLLGGDQPYTSMYMYRPMVARPISSGRFFFEAAFQLSVPSNEVAPVADAVQVTTVTVAVAGAPPQNLPPVQAVEFLVKKQHRQLSYEWRLQWRSSGETGPCWYYWNPGAVGGWTATEIPAVLEPGVWHRLTMHCRVWNGRPKYETVVIDGQTNVLDVSLAPGRADGSDTTASVGLSLIANARSDVCEFLVDAVNLRD
jgi:hypothetical protein